jgi:predicted MFS family arabinose efflux permease
MGTTINKTFTLYKESFADHPREIWTLVVLTFINRSGTMVLPFLTVYLTTVLNFSFKDAGILAGAFGIGSFVGAFIGGKLTDRFGPKMIIVASLFLSGIMFILIQYAHSFSIIFLTFFIAAVFGEGYRPAFMAYVTDYVPKEKRGRTMALLRLAVNLGMSAGPLVGGFLAAGFGYKWLFWIDGLTCIFAAFYFVLKLGKSGLEKIPKEEKVHVEKQKNSLPPYKNYNYLLFLFSSFIIGLAFDQWFHSVPVFLKSEWGFDERYIGMLMAINTILIVLVELPAIHTLEKLNKIKLSILLSLVLMSISFLPLLFEGALYLCIIGVILFSLGEILFFPFNNTIPLNMSPESRIGDYTSWYWMTWSLTSIFAPVTGLMIAEKFGFDVLWISMSALILVGFALNYFGSRRIIEGESQ